MRPELLLAQLDEVNLDIDRFVEEKLSFDKKVSNEIPGATVCDAGEEQVCELAVVEALKKTYSPTAKISDVKMSTLRAAQEITKLLRRYPSEMEAALDGICYEVLIEACDILGRDLPGDMGDPDHEAELQLRNQTHELFIQR